MGYAGQPSIYIFDCVALLVGNTAYVQCDVWLCVFFPKCYLICVHHAANCVRFAGQYTAFSIPQHIDHTSRHTFGGRGVPVRAHVRRGAA